MKTNYLLAAILACSTVGAFVAHRGLKTALTAASALIAAYALLRQVL